MSESARTPSTLVSFLPIAILVAMLAFTIRIFGGDALSGGSQISLLVTSASCVIIGMAFYKVPWQSFENAITKNIAGVSSAIIILLIIGIFSK